MQITFLYSYEFLQSVLIKREFMIFVRLSVAHYFRLKDFEITGGINNDPHLIIMLLELVIYVK